MRPYTYLVLAFLMPASALASTEDCSQTKDTAEKIMFSRQQGVDLETLKRTVLANANIEGAIGREQAAELADKALKLLDKAYSTPVEGMLSRKHLASQDFSRASFLSCINGKPLLNPKKAIGDPDIIRRITDIEGKPKTKTL